MTQMTKENFEEFAKIFAKAENPFELKRLLIIYFKRNNPRFDEHRFKKRVKELEKVM